MEAPPDDPPLANPFLASLSKEWACFSEINPSLTARPQRAGTHSENQISIFNLLFFHGRSQNILLGFPRFSISLLNIGAQIDT